MSRHLNQQQNNINKVATVLPTFLNCVGLMPKGPCSSLSSLALQKGNISLPQVGPQKARLYLQRASSQHTISMQKHAHRCTMEYIRTCQRSFVAPVSLQICFISVSHPLGSSVVFWRSRMRRGNTKEKGACLCGFFSVSEKGGGQSLFSPQLCVSLENRLKCAEKLSRKPYYVGITS